MKEKSLAVSKRDRQLLSILLAVVVLFALYYFLAGPAWDRGAQLTEEKAAAAAVLEKTNAMLAEAPQKEKEVEAKRAELQEKYAMFLYDINEARILHQMDGLMTAAAFPVNSYLHADPVIEPVTMPQAEFEAIPYPLYDIAMKLNPALVEPLPAGNNASESGNEVGLASLKQMDVSANFSNAGYEAVYRYLTALESLDRTYIVSSIAMGRNQDTADLQGQILIRAISLPKVNEEENTDLQFQPAVPQGRTNPF